VIDVRKRFLVTSPDVRAALIQLEEALDIGQPIGASELPDEIRFFRVLSSLRDILCPRLGLFVKAADTDAGDLAAIIADTIVSAVGKFPIPAATISKRIAAMGFDRFCEDPNELLQDANGQQEEGRGADAGTPSREIPAAE
jgi:hypothetical protein